MSFVLARGAGTEVKAIDASAVERDLTSNWVSGGPTLNAPSIDVTSIADSGVKRRIGLEDHTFSMTFLYDNAVDKSWAVFKDRWGEDTPRNLLFYPEADASGKPRITISVLVTQVSFGVSVGERMTIDVSFESDGVATIDTVV